MHAAAVVVSFFSVLFPVRTWFAPDGPMNVQIKPPADTEISLLLTDFTGKPIEASGQNKFTTEQTADLRSVFQPITAPGTYIVWAVPKGKLVADFVGTPLVISVREDKRRDAPPGAMVAKVDPLCYATLATESGEATIIFYYDSAPHTVANFIGLSMGGFYDGLPFHRIVPGFIVQGGDPRGDGTGGPGYTIDAEFNDREHREGVISMARQGDPLEAQGAAPRPDFANTAGSQFFICLNYERTKQLDRRYTAFGKVIEGMPVIEAMSHVAQGPEHAAENIGENRDGNAAGQADAQGAPPLIKSITIHAVEPGKNPYAAMMSADKQDRPDRANPPTGG